MERSKSDLVSIRKQHLFYAIIAIVFLLIGFFGSSFSRTPLTTGQDTTNCKQFCEFIPNTEFAYVDSNSHCFCTQKNQRVFDTQLNKTLVYTKTVDAGIITDVQIKNFIDQSG